MESKEQGQFKIEALCPSCDHVNVVEMFHMEGEMYASVYTCDGSGQQVYLSDKYKNFKDGILSRFMIPN